MKTISKLKITLLLSTAFLISCSNAQIQTISENTLSESKIDQFIIDEMKKLGMPGMSIAIINDAKVVYHKQFGKKDLASNLNVTENTLFEAASMTKPVFGFLVMKLVDQNIIDLDTPLCKYLPFEDIAHDDRYKKITARMVLSHTTGFPNWRDKKFSELEILNEPGTTFGYSGEGFGYLGRVVKHLTSQNLEKLINEEVFQPFGMNKSYFVWNEFLEKNKATGYQSGNMPARIYKPLVPHMAGNLHSESLDFAQFIIGIMNNQGLSEKSMEEFLGKQVDLPENHEFIENFGQSEWGLGIARGQTDYGVVHSHGGSNGDFESHFEFFKEQKIGYVFFTNCGKGAIFNAKLNEFLRRGYSESAELEKSYEIVNRSIRKITDKQKDGIELYKKAAGDGIAWLKNQDFSEGTIEFDLKGNNREGESFVGIAFYGENNSTFDCLYFRPYLFDSKVSDEKNAMIQYLSLPEFNFYRLRDERPFEFESEIENPPNPEDWFHVKLIIKSGTLKVYIDESKNPEMEINLLSEKRKNGKIGFWVGYMSSGKFANLKIEKD